MKKLIATTLTSLSLIAPVSAQDLLLNVKVNGTDPIKVETYISWYCPNKPPTAPEPWEGKLDRIEEGCIPELIILTGDKPTLSRVIQILRTLTETR